MYTIETPRFYATFPTYAQLVNYLVAHNHTSFWDSKIHNSIFDDVSNNPNDLRPYIDDRGNPILAPRQTLIYDTYGRNLYNHELIYDVFNTPFSQALYDEWEASQRLPYERHYVFLHGWVKTLPRFRIDPVPGTGRCHPIRYHYRRNHYIHDNRLTQRDPLVRAKRRSIPSPWELEATRSDYHNHGWKTQGKYRHQFEVRQRRTSKKKEVGYYEN